MTQIPRDFERVVVEPIELSVSPDSALGAFAGDHRPVMLEGLLNSASQGKFTILASEPLETFALAWGASANPFSVLRSRMSQWPVITYDLGLPFVGGWIGHMAYEAGLSAAGLACKPSETMDGSLLDFGLYDHAAVYDHDKHQWSAVAIEWAGGQRERASKSIARIRDRLEAANASQTKGDNRVRRGILGDEGHLFSGGSDWGRLHSTNAWSKNGPIPERVGLFKNAALGMTRFDYDAMVERAKRYIEAGDIYQVNLSQRFTTETPLPPVELYRRLRRINPAPCGAFLGLGSEVLHSVSPELFLKVKNGHVVTRPIKGTRPRWADSQADAEARRMLADSEKDGAELAMIVDLLRNDLGRVCAFGTVRVTEPSRIEAHPTVFHRVATIEGDLAAGRDITDLLEATFPGGSITGAPKIRAMQIIDELEPVPRGPYCGAIGLWGLDGSLTLNVAIRTMVQRGKRVDFHAGGAIMGESNADEEYEEVLAKAAGMAEALECQLVASEESLPHGVPV